MPELPEVETILNGLKTHLLSHQINKIHINRPNLRIPFPPDITKTKRVAITRVYRRAKYMLWELENNKTLILHLGMSGKLLLYKDKYLKGKHDHIEFHLTNDNILVLNDPRRFGLVTITDTNNISSHKLIKNLGIEPLDEDFNAYYLAEKCLNKTRPIKNLLMDNKIIVGVGNIYACESLYAAKINPIKCPSKLTFEQISSLVTSIKKILIEAIKAGGSTLKDYQKSDGSMGYFQHNFAVYNQFQCKNCGVSIKKIRQLGRTTFYCSSCQV